MNHRRIAWVAALVTLILLAIGLWHLQVVQPERRRIASLKGQDFGLSVTVPLQSAALSRDGRSLLFCYDNGVELYDITKSPAVLHSRTQLKLSVVTYSALLNDELVGLQDKETLLIVRGRTNEVLVREHCADIPRQVWLAGEDRVFVMYSDRLAIFNLNNTRVAPVAERIQLPPGYSLGFGSYLANVHAGRINIYTLAESRLTHLSTIASERHYVDCILDGGWKFLAVTDGSSTSIYTIANPKLPVAVLGSEHETLGEFLGFIQPNRIAYRRSSVALTMRPSHELFIPCSPFTSKRFCSFDAEHSLCSLGFAWNGDFLHIDTSKRLVRLPPPVP